MATLIQADKVQVLLGGHFICRGPAFEWNGNTCVADFSREIQEVDVKAPRTLAEISGPVYQRFLDSGTTDEQLSEELERAKHEMRAKRRDTRRAS